MLKIQYRNAKDGGIEVLRCFSQEQQVTIPAQIEGKAVTKIGDYAFSSHKRKDADTTDCCIRQHNAAHIRIHRRISQIITGCITVLMHPVFYCFLHNFYFTSFQNLSTSSFICFKLHTLRSRHSLGKSGT